MFKIEKLDLLVAIYIFCIVISEIMSGKTFPVANIFGFQLNSSVGIFVLPLIYGINDIVTEVYGKERARSIVRSGLIIIVLIILTTLFFTQLPPTQRFASTESAYDMIFSMSARIAFASLVAFAVADFLDIYIFAKIRERLGKKALWFRTNASNFISQFIDTALFITLAFYALDRSFNDNFLFLFSLIIPFWLLKCFMSVIETPLVYLGVKWLKKK